MTLFVVALVWGIWPFGQSGSTERHTYRIPAWHIKTERDRFTNRVECRLYQGKRKRPNVSYQRGTLAFAFARSRDTLAADFSVDGGPTRPWSSVYPDLVGAGAPIANKSMTNPTQGYVLLPMTVVAEATSVAIRPTRNAKPVTFSLLGLTDALDAAKRLGCDPDYGFVRTR